MRNGFLFFLRHVTIDLKKKLMTFIIGISLSRKICEVYKQLTTLFCPCQMSLVGCDEESFQFFHMIPGLDAENQ